MLNIMNNLSPNKYAKLIELTESELCVKMNYLLLFGISFPPENRAI